MAELPCRLAAVQGRRALRFLVLMASVINIAGKMTLQDGQGALCSGGA